MSRILNPEMVALGKRIQARREQKQWSQQDMLTKLQQQGLDVTRGAYSHWESGRVNLPAMALIALTDILDLSADYLLGKQSEEEWLDDEVIQWYREISPDFRHAARAMMKALCEASDRQRTTHGRKALDTEADELR